MNVSLKTKGNAPTMDTAEDPLVSTDWLAAHLGDAHLRVIDASFKMPGVVPRSF